MVVAEVVDVGGDSDARVKVGDNGSTVGVGGGAVEDEGGGSSEGEGWQIDCSRGLRERN